jgi:hypothetical protein
MAGKSTGRPAIGFVWSRDPYQLAAYYSGMIVDLFDLTQGRKIDDLCTNSIGGTEESVQSSLRNGLMH